jgi:hypothetical protein
MLTNNDYAHFVHKASQLIQVVDDPGVRLTDVVGYSAVGYLTPPATGKGDFLMVYTEHDFNDFKRYAVQVSVNASSERMKGPDKYPDTIIVFNAVTQAELDKFHEGEDDDEEEGKEDVPFTLTVIPCVKTFARKDNVYFFILFFSLLFRDMFLNVKIVTLSLDSHTRSLRRM